MTDANGCSSTSTGVVFVGVENITENGLTIYPNPVVDELTIVYTGQQTLDYRIHDASGKVVKQGTCERRLNVNDLATGVYLITVTDNNLESRRVFVKE